jgi:hypothetical protein
LFGAFERNFKVVTEFYEALIVEKDSACCLILFDQELLFLRKREQKGSSVLNVLSRSIFRQRDSDVAANILTILSFDKEQEFIPSLDIV